MSRAPGLVYEDLPAALRRQLEDRALAAHPEPAALLVTGSYAIGSATRTSDLDLRLLTWAPPGGYESWFVEAPAGTLHVSFGVGTVDDWHARSTRVEPWALGFPARHRTRAVWMAPGARERLGDDPSQLSHPPAPPELEDCFEALRKAVRHGAAGAWQAARWHARDAAERMPGLLLGINPYRGVDDRLDALHAALELPVAPVSWADDLPVLLGLVEATDEDVVETALRLGLDLLALLRDHVPGVDPQPGLREALADGTLERLLRETAGAPR